MRLYAAQRDYREFSEFIVDEDLDKIANVIAASEAAESAIEDASELCRSNPEYSGDIDESMCQFLQYRLPWSRQSREWSRLCKPPRGRGG